MELSGAVPLAADVAGHPAHGIETDRRKRDYHSAGVGAVRPRGGVARPHEIAESPRRWLAADPTHLVARHPRE